MYRLLIADDLRRDRERAALCLQRTPGIEIVGQVEDGEQALAFLRAQTVDFVLTDVEMPRRNGIELARAIEAQRLDTIVAFMSCHDDVPYLLSAIDLHVAGYVMKPVEEEELAVLFTTLIERRNEAERTRRVIEESRVLLTNRFLHRLCAGLFESEEEARAEAALVSNGTPYGDCFLPIVITAADSYKPEQTVPQMMLAWRVRSLAQEEGVLGGQADELRHVLLLFGADIQPKAKRVLAALSDASVWALCGAHCDRLQSVAASYQSAREALRARLRRSLPCEKEGRFAAFEPGVVLERVRFVLLSQDSARIEAYIDEAAEGIGALQSAALRTCAASTFAVAVNAVLCEAGLSLEMLEREDFAAFCWEGDRKRWLSELLRGAAAILSAVQCGKVGQIVADITAYIEENLSQEITVRKLANVFYFSPNYLNLLFRQRTGQTIPEYVQRLRMEHAKKLLRVPTMKVSEVMKAVGYHKASYFNKIFKEQVGLTPQQFRSVQ